MAPFNARNMVSTTVVSLTRPWEGMRVLEAGQLMCARVSLFNVDLTSIE
jgi:hypothetical protein